MKKKMITPLIFTLTFLISFSVSTFSAYADPVEIAATDGNAIIAFTSLANNGNFSPRHVLAVWIEQENGTFVRSLKVRADKRKQYLYTWNANTSGNTSDAITGATLSDHQTHILSWNLRAANGTLVNDGNYVIRVEYTSEHAQGPLMSVSFSKGTIPVTVTPADETYFKSISLSYVPDVTTGIDPQNAHGINVYPIPASEKVTVDHAAGYIVNIYDNAGRVVKSVSKIPSEHFEIDITDLEDGSYILVGANKGDTFRQLIQVVR